MMNNDEYKWNINIHTLQLWVWLVWWQEKHWSWLEMPFKTCFFNSLSVWQLHLSDSYYTSDSLHIQLTFRPFQHTTELITFSFLEEAYKSYGYEAVNRLKCVISFLLLLLLHTDSYHRLHLFHRFFSIMCLLCKSTRLVPELPAHKHVSLL